jgi:hypothetical protein
MSLWKPRARNGLGDNRAMGRSETPSARTAWIAEDLDRREAMMLTGRFSGYIETGDEVVESFDDLSADEAIAWGRERAAFVLIRTGDGDYHSAGDLNPDPERFPRWPPSGLRLERRRPHGFEALDNTEDDPPVLWDVRIDASPFGDLDARAFYDKVRAHPATRDVQAPAPGYPAASAAFLVQTATEREAREIGDAILWEAVEASLEASSEDPRGFVTYGAEVYPHRPWRTVSGPGVTF